MTILIVVLIVAAVIIMWATPLTSLGDQVQSLQTESKLMHEIMHADAHLHRLLLVETLAHGIGNGIDEIGDEATFEQMQAGMAMLGNNLLSAVGHVTSQRLSNLFQHRCDIFRDYYEWIRRGIIEKRMMIPRGIIENSSQQETMVNPQTLDAFSPISELTEMSERGIDDNQRDEDLDEDQSEEEEEEIEEERPSLPIGAHRPSPNHRPFRFDDSLEISES